MGKDCAHAIGEAIAEAAADQKQTDGVPFPKNDKDYAEMKARKYGFAPPAFGFRTGQMLSIESLLGEIEIDADRVVVRYGTGRAPERSSASGYISEADKRTTDREKADLMHHKARKRAQFFQIGVAGRAAVLEVVKDALTRHLTAAMGGRRG